MGVDRGGLDYTIRVRDDFDANLVRFTAKTKAARAAWKALKDEMAGGGSKSSVEAEIKGVDRLIARRSKLARDAERDADRAVRRETAAARERDRNIDRTARLNRQAAADAERTQRRAERDAQTARRNNERAIAAANQAARAQQRALDQQARTADKAAKAAARAARDQQRDQDKIAREAERAARSQQKAADAAARAQAKNAAKALNDQQRAIRGIEREIELQERAEARAAGVALKAQQRALAATPEGRAAAIAQRAATNRGAASLLAQQGLDTQGNPLQSRGLKDRIRDFLRLGEAQDKVNKSGGVLANTFKRIFGVLLAFAAVRTVINGFRSIIEESIKFNAELEQANLAIASLFTAVGDVRDATGAAVDASRALAVAQIEARRQTQLLRRDALKTAATFDDLLETFQVAVGPGLQAGLNVDQIRKFTVQISQAASAIGLAQNQLSEEIRSILAGTIQPRNTRIATALGITNEDIRNAKELGILADFLQQRFAAFTVAGEESLKTFDALLTNVKDAFFLIVSTGSIEFFQRIKVLLKDTFDFLTNQDPVTGLLRPSPEALAAVEAISNGLTDAVVEAQRLARALGAINLVNVAQSLGAGIRVTAKVVGAIVEGFVKGINDARKAVVTITSIIERLTGVSLFDNDNIFATITGITRIITFVLTLSGIVTAIKFGIGLIGKTLAAASLLLRGIVILAQTALKVAGLIVSPVGVIVASVALLFIYMKKALDAATGLNLKFITFARIIIDAVAANFNLLWLNIKFGWENVFEWAKNTFNKISTKILNAGTEVVEGLLAIVAPISDTADAQIKKLSKARAERNIDLEQSLLKSKEHLDVLKQQFDIERQQIDLINKKQQKVNVEEDPNTPTIAEKLKELLGPALEDAKKLFKEVFDSIVPPDANILEEPLTEAEKLSSVLSELPGIIGRSNRELEGASDIVKKLREDLEKAQDFFRAGKGTIGLQGSVLSQRKQTFEAEVDIREDSKKITIAEKEANADLLGIRRQIVANEQRFRALSQANQVLVERGVEAGRQLAATQNEIAQTETTIALEKAKANDATQRGFTEEKAAAELRASAAEETLRLLKDRLTAEKRATDAILEGVNPETATALTQIITSRIQLAGQEVSIQANLSSLAESRREVENKVNEALALRVDLAAQERAFELGRDIASQRLALEQRINEVRGEAIFLSEDTLPEKRALVASKAELEVLRLQKEQAEELRQIELSNLELLLAQAQARRTSLDLQIKQNTDATKGAVLQEQAKVEDGNILSLQKQLLLQKQLNTIERGKENVEIDLATQKVELNRRIAEEPVKTGVAIGFKQFAEEAPTLFSGTVEIIKSTFTNFASFVSSTIVDAFDPTAKVDIKERFARFLQGIAEQIINMLVQVALTKALLNLGFLGGFAGGGAIEPPSGFAHGGRIHDAHGRWTPRHRHAAGRSTGGGTDRPRGLDPTDTIPIWAAPGEWVIRARAVARYGHDVMASINAGLVDPTALRSIAATRGRGILSRRGPGFAEGGLISDAIRTVASAQRSSQPTTATISGPVVARVAPTVENFRRQLAGGGAALMDFVSEHAAEFNARLGR